MTGRLRWLRAGLCACLGATLTLLTPAPALAAPPGAPAPATASTSVLARADALVEQASGAYDDPARAPQARAALRQARQMLARGRLTPEDLDLAQARVGYALSWVEAGAHRPAQARAAALEALQRARRWRPPGAPEVLWPRQALFAQAVVAQHWTQAQQALRPLMPYLDFDGQRCGDELCAAVLTHRSMLHAALGETALAYSTRLASHRFLVQTGLRPPLQLAWDELSLAHLAHAQGETALALHWLDAVAQRARQAGLPADAPMVQQARALRPQWAEALAPQSPATWRAARAQALQDDAAAVAARGWLDEDREALLLGCAQASARLDEPVPGLRCAAEALAVAWSQPGDTTRLGEVYALQQLGQLATQAGAPRLATLLGKWALNALQRQRARLRTLPPEQQAHYLRLWQDSYQQLADQLLNQRRLGEAEQVLALARDAEYHELVRGTAEAAELALRADEQPTLRTLQALRTRLRQAARTDAAARGGARPAIFAQALAALQALLQAEPGAETAAPSITPVPPLAPLPTLAAAPATGPHLLYLPGPEHLRIAVQTDGRTTVREVDVGERELLERVAALRQAVQDPGSDPRPAARALYTLLWAPVADLLPPDAPLQIQAEGVLRYLPFGLLHDGQGWLLTRHTLAMDAGPAPAGARRDSGRPVAPHRGWALLGSARAAGLPALPEVPTELQTLARLAPRVPTPELRLDGQFTRATLRQALAQRRVVHIASHFRLVPGDAQASWLQLGGGQRVSLAELARPGFDFHGVDLLTLSACETAVPAGVDARGSALESLAHVALLRGARQVLASLWTVPDEDTARLMGDFYRAYAAGQTAPEALRQAQMARMQVSPHPSAWGGFVLLDRP